MNNQDGQLPSGERIVPNFIFGVPGVCSYCGEKANSIDHVIPLSSYKTIPRKKRDDTGIRTYACGSCNGVLGAKVFQTFKERVGFINLKNTARSQKFARDASWSDQEIADLDSTLRSYVASRQLAMRELDRRVSWPDSAGFWKTISTLYDVHCLDKSSPKFKQWVFDYFCDYL